jgi:hypothetical protein
VGDDFQPCAVHCSGAGHWIYAQFVGVLGGQGALWDCDVSKWMRGAGALRLADDNRGGLYGPAAATALEDLPYDARGVLSGLYQVCLG